MHKRSSKILTTLTILTLVLPVLSSLIPVPMVEAAPSGTITIFPNKVVTSITSYIAVSGGTFPAGSPLYYLTHTTTTWPLGAAGSYFMTLPSGAVTIPAGYSIPVTLTQDSYILVSDSPSGATGSITHATAISVASTGPTITSITSSGNVGSTIYIEGYGFSASATVNIYWSYAGNLQAAVTSNPDGTLDSSFTVPAAAQGTYKVFAYDAVLLVCASKGGVNYAEVTVTPSIVPSNSILGDVASTVTLTGSGLPADKTISASAIGSPQSNVLIGGVVTYHGAATTSSLGAVTVVVTGLATAISVTGPVDVTITYTDGTTTTVTGAVIVANPNVRGDEQLTLTYTSRYYGQSVPFKLWNFPGSTAVTLTIGSLTLGTALADANGATTSYTSGGTVPAMPSGSYVIYASTATGYVASASFTVTSRVRLYKGTTFAATTRVRTTNYVDYWDIAAAARTKMWVEAYGLQPSTSYTLTYDIPGVYKYDVVATDGDPGEDNLSPAVTTGTFTSADKIKTDATGSFLVSFGVTFTYSANYDSDGITPATGTACTIAATPATGDAATHTFMLVGTPDFDRTWYSGTQSATITGLRITDLVPLQNYQLRLDVPVLTVTYGTTLAATSFQADSSGASPTMAFTADPTAGRHDLAIQYQTTTFNLATKDQISSTAGGVAASTMSHTSRRRGNSLIFRGWNFVAGESLSIYMAKVGLIASVAADSNGAFRQSYTVTDAQPSGTYLTWISRSSTTTVLEPTTQPLTITSYLSRSPSSGLPGESVSVTGYGFKANNPYRFVWMFDSLLTGGVAPTWAVLYEDSTIFTADSNGKFTGSIKVPLVPASTKTKYAYRIYVYEVLGAATTGIYSSFVVKSGTPLTGAPTVDTVPTLTASKYSLYPLEKTTLTLSGVGAALTEPVDVVIVVNDAASQSIRGAYDATTGKIKVTFEMPNGAAGPLRVYCLWKDSTAAPGTLSGRSPTATSGNEIIMVRIEGSGSLTITGVDLSADIAYLKSKADAQTVKLSDLEAKIVDLTDDVALIDTNIGLVSANVTAINASLVSVKGDVATIKTDLGTVKVDVAAIKPKVISIEGDVAKVKTDVGTISGKVTTIDGSVATIKTDVGTIKADVSAVKTSVAAASTAATGAKTAVEAMTSVLYAAVILALVAAGASVFSVVQITRKIAG